VLASACFGGALVDFADEVSHMDKVTSTPTEVNLGTDAGAATFGGSHIVSWAVAALVPSLASPLEETQDDAHHAALHEDRNGFESKGRHKLHNQQHAVKHTGEHFEEKELAAEGKVDYSPPEPSFIVKGVHGLKHSLHGNRSTMVGLGRLLAGKAALL
jgi:hypothetical protein